MVRCSKLSACGRRWDSIGALQRSVLASGGCGLCHPACFTILVLWEMRERVVISLGFEIVGSLCPRLRWPLCLQRKGLPRIGYNPASFFGQRNYPDQYCVVVDQTFTERFQQFYTSFLHFCICRRSLPWRARA